MKKRVLSLLMASAMIVGLTACGSSNEPAATASTDSGNTAATTADNSGSAAAGNVSMTSPGGATRPEMNVHRQPWICILSRIPV